MKINSGKYKYRRIVLPEDIRPTTEKVREAICSMVMGSIEGSSVLDLFAGSGVMGIEFLSRGALHCVFNDQSARHLAALRENLRNCGAESDATVLQMDFRKCLRNRDQVYDLIFLDPPYASGYYEEAIDIIEERRLLSEEGILIAEHLYDNQLSDTYGDLACFRRKKYGTIGVDLFSWH